MTTENKVNHINFNNTPRSYKNVFNEPLNINFSPIDKIDKSKSIPDVVVVGGRLFLNQKSYDVLQPLIKNDSEFLSVNYQKGEWYFFTPLRVAKVDKKVTIKNEWGDIISIGFNKADVDGWSVFRTEYDAFIGLYCQGLLSRLLKKRA